MIKTLPEKFANEKECPNCGTTFLPPKDKLDTVYCVECEKNPTRFFKKNPDVILETINISELKKRIEALESAVFYPAKTTYTKKCNGCGNDFEADAPATKLCDVCRESE